MNRPAEGCGKTEVPLTLYFVVSGRKVRALPGKFDMLPCGRVFQAPAQQLDCYGITLCQDCAFRAYPHLERTACPSWRNGS